MKTLGDAQFVDDFMAGMWDCQLGNPPRKDASEAYLRGYGAEYELGEVKTAMTEMQERLER